MPVAETAVSNELEAVAYELAFHVLPTVTEGEVTQVFDRLKNLITKAGGSVTAEEMPERFDLAYEIEKYLEGKRRRFSSAYFGWVRFKLKPSALSHLTEEVDAQKELLRYLFIKLTKVEEENHFRFHESIAHRKVITIDDEALAEVAEEAEVEVAGAVEVKETAAADSVPPGEKV